MLKIIRKYSKFGFVLLLPAYFLILANSILNRHTHILPNGIMVTHSHPFAKNANGEKQTTHNHSGKSFLFLQSFCMGHHLVSDNIVLPQKFEYACLIQIFLSVTEYHEVIDAGISPRAPPVFS